MADMDGFESSNDFSGPVEMSAPLKKSSGKFAPNGRERVARMQRPEPRRFVLAKDQRGRSQHRPRFALEKRRAQSDGPRLNDLERENVEASEDNQSLDNGVKNGRSEFRKEKSSVGMSQAKIANHFDENRDSRKSIENTVDHVNVSDNSESDDNQSSAESDESRELSSGESAHSFAGAAAARNAPSVYADRNTSGVDAVDSARQESRLTAAKSSNSSIRSKKPQKAQRRKKSKKAKEASKNVAEQNKNEQSTTTNGQVEANSHGLGGAPKKIAFAKNGAQTEKSRVNTAQQASNNGQSSNNVTNDKEKSAVDGSGQSKSFLDAATAKERKLAAALGKQLLKFKNRQQQGSEAIRIVEEKIERLKVKAVDVVPCEIRFRSAEHAKTHYEKMCKKIFENFENEILEVRSPAPGGNVCVAFAVSQAAATRFNNEFVWNEDGVPHATTTGKNLRARQFNVNLARSVMFSLKWLNDDLEQEANHFEKPIVASNAVIGLSSLVGNDESDEQEFLSKFGFKGTNRVTMDLIGVPQNVHKLYATIGNQVIELKSDKLISNERKEKTKRQPFSFATMATANAVVQRPSLKRLFGSTSVDEKAKPIDSPANLDQAVSNASAEAQQQPDNGASPPPASAVNTSQPDTNKSSDNTPLAPGPWISGQTPSYGDLTSKAKADQQDKNSAQTKHQAKKKNGGWKKQITRKSFNNNARPRNARSRPVNDGQTTLNRDSFATAAEADENEPTPAEAADLERAKKLSIKTATAERKRRYIENMKALKEQAAQFQQRQSPTSVDSDDDVEDKLVKHADNDNVQYNADDDMHAKESAWLANLVEYDSNPISCSPCSPPAPADDDPDRTVEFSQEKVSNVGPKSANSDLAGGALSSDDADDDDDENDNNISNQQNNQSLISVTNMDLIETDGNTNIDGIIVESNDKSKENDIELGGAASTQQKDVAHEKSFQNDCAPNDSGKSRSNQSSHDDDLIIDTLNTLTHAHLKSQSEEVENNVVANELQTVDPAAPAAPQSQPEHSVDKPVGESSDAQDREGEESLDHSTPSAPVNNEASESTNNVANKEKRSTKSMPAFSPIGTRAVVAQREKSKSPTKTTLGQKASGRNSKRN
jgi:hypothetical protein